MQAKITLLPGDGVGPEVVAAAVKVLDAVAAKHNHSFQYQEALFGIAGIIATGEALPKNTIKVCEDCAAILLGAVGGPAGSTPPGSPRPEAGLLALRKHFGLFANLRPVHAYPVLTAQVPLRADLVEGVDILFFRELTGGIYFGPRMEIEESEDEATAYDTMLYTTPEVERIARLAFEAAGLRDKFVVSVDKANVLASSRLWRAAVNDVAKNYPDIRLEHALVDSFAMRLMTDPASWDVVVTENMFGDILSDQASVLAGSLGMLPSASLNESRFGLYEPVHGSAPDIAGKGIANPTGTILSAAMLLRHSLGLDTEAKEIESAVDSALQNGARTADIKGTGRSISTDEFTAEIISALN
ncbi:MAG TPA: 3-isopropylmalate dehydrogenase [Aggregatilineales bacterium]|nr:3-isopropylmalate dehydrogenase [Aggregatilineales bacterium]